MPSVRPQKQLRGIEHPALPRGHWISIRYIDTNSACIAHRGYSCSMKREEALKVVAELAAAQWGLFTTGQAKSRDLTGMDLRRLEVAGLVQRVERGVYRELGAPVDRFEQLRASWLALDPGRTAERRLFEYQRDYVVSGSSATQLFEVGDLLDEEDFFTAVDGRKQSVRGRVRLSQRNLPGEQITIVQGLPTTTIERTIVDLIRDDVDLSLVAGVLRDAHRHPGVDLDELGEQLGAVATRVGFARGDGHAVLNRLTSIADLGSPAEEVVRTVFAEVLKDMNLPTAITVRLELSDLISASPQMQELSQQMARVAASQVDLPTGGTQISLDGQTVSPLVSAEFGQQVARQIAEMIAPTIREAVQGMQRAADGAQRPGPEARAEEDGS